MAIGSPGSRISLPFGILVLAVSVLHGTKSQLVATDGKLNDDKQIKKAFGNGDPLKCPDNQANSDGLYTVLLARLKDKGSNLNLTERLNRLVFPVDRTILDLNIVSSGWRFRLWNVKEKVQPTDPSPPCYTQVVESGPESKFEFTELPQGDAVSAGLGRGGDGEKSLRPGRDDTCREFTSDTCSVIEDLGDGKGGDDDGGQLYIRYEESCRGDLNIHLPSSGLHYLELFREPGAQPAEVSVTGRSDLNFHFNFSTPIYNVPVAEQPIAGDTYVIKLTFWCWEVVDTAQSELVIYSESGQVLEKVGILQNGVIGITIAHENFYVGVEGVDVYEEKFVRISPDMVRPRMFVLSFPTPAHREELHPKQNLDVRIRLRNRDKSDTFTVKTSFSSYIDYLTAEITPKVLEVKQNGFKEIHVVISVHDSISQKISSQLTIEVTRHSDLSLTSITRDVTATPDSFGEDTEPPSCSTIYETSKCDPEVNCSANTWEAGVLVDDLSGVYAAFFSKRLMSSISYLQARGKLRAQALVRRDCCSPNATLHVEDYVGNHQVCVLEAPSFRPQRAVSGPKLTSASNSGDLTAAPEHRANSSDEQGEGYSTQALQDTDVDVTTTTEIPKSEDDTDTKEDELWTPQLLAKLKILAIIMGCVLASLLLYCVLTLARKNKKQEKDSKPSANAPSRAFNFSKKRSSRKSTPPSGQTKSEHVQMTTMKKSSTAALPENLMKAPGGVRVEHTARINEAFSPEDTGGEMDLKPSNQIVKLGLKGGGRSVEPGRAAVAEASSGSASLTSLAFSRGDEAYSSFRSATGTKGPNSHTKERSVSQMSISDLDPKNKTEIYERILQCRELLEQLEKKRATLMKSANFKHHTVPRIKQDIRHAEINWDVEKVPGQPSDFEDKAREILKPEKDVEPEGPGDFGKYRKEVGQTDSDSAEVDTKRAFSSPASPAIPLKNLGLSLKDDTKSEIDSDLHEQHSFLTNSKVRTEKNGRMKTGPIRNAATPPELSQGHVSNLIEGATQISLRHEIQRLRERLLAYSKVVEDELHYKKDLYERLSMAGDQDLEDSDNDDS